MYLHAGGGVILRDSSIIGIFDLDGKVTTPDRADFLRKAEKDGVTSLAGDDLPKCFILTAPARKKKKPKSEKTENTKVIFSHISAGKLSGRGDALTGL